MRIPSQVLVFSRLTLLDRLVSFKRDGDEWCKVKKK